MPTIKPRVVVTMPQSLYDSISALASLQCRSRGAVILDLLLAAQRPLQRTVALLQAAAVAPDDLKRGLAGNLLAAERAVFGAHSRALDQLDELTASLRSVEGRESAATAASRPDQRLVPPYSNTGVTK